MARKAGRFLVEILALLLVLILVDRWRTRNMVRGGEPVPPMQCATVNGEPFSLEDYRGKKIVLYFFAPWCQVCGMNWGAIQRAEGLLGDSAEVVPVMLGWQDMPQAEQYVTKKNISVPVRACGPEVRDTYKVTVYPSFYFVDSKGNVRSKTTGYTSAPGIWFRTFLLD